MKKICFVTAARSEYGLLKWLMRDINISEEFEMQLIVTGGHLLEEQGNTIQQIIKDGFVISEKVDIDLNLSSTSEIAASMGRMAEAFALAFERLKPDYLLVLGDRYELLPICNTAFVMDIPIIHLSGGDVTKGTIDNGVRNAITMLATYHFPGTAQSAINIERMRGSSKNIWAVGEPGLDAFNYVQLISRKDLAEDLKLDENKRWILMTYHPETKQDLSYNIDVIHNCIKALKELDGFQILMTYANADFGGKQINDYIVAVAKEEPKKFKVISSLGQERYLSYMKQASLVIGNSSSGIVEAPFLKIPVVNIGNRQEGRYQCNNIVQCSADKNDISKALLVALNKEIKEIDLNYWGNGHTSEKILNILVDVLK